MMRISGGKVKGTRLKTLPKRSVRPTTNVVRQAIFSLLGSRTASWHRVLDLFAGSGTLGIEALSRGAEWVDFVDYRRSCCDLIRANLKRIGVMQWSHVYCCNVSKAITFLEGSYDIIFMDPPYSDSAADGLLGTLANSRLLSRNSTIVLCHANRFPLNPDYDGLHLIEQRRYGDTFIFMYQKEV
jgi:16S rRNA (guanine966-N2)-methyltransferase